jgi:hypothetical protein
MSDQFGSRDWAEATSAKFPVGSDVSVSYNPEKPEVCVLEPGRWGGAGFLIVAAGLLIVFPPVVLKGLWSSKTPDAGYHPREKSRRFLNGIEFRERILTWEPGEAIHLQQESMGFLSLVAGALIAGLILGGFVGLTPALLFFSGRGPVFIGQFYLASSLVAASVCGIWLWLDNRPRQTHIEYHSQQIRLVTGSKQTDALFSDVQQLVLYSSKAAEGDCGRIRPAAPNLQSTNQNDRGRKVVYRSRDGIQNDGVSRSANCVGSYRQAAGHNNECSL